MTDPVTDPVTDPATDPATDPVTEPALDAGLTALTYEAARDELVQVVQRLEAGGVSLEESVALWERGELLAEVCQQRLDGVRARLDAAVGRTDDSAQA